MEADINDIKETDFPENGRDSGQEYVKKMSPQGDKDDKHFFSLKSSTPIVDKDENGLMKQMPTLQSNDSGFSEGTFSLTPASSIKGTPCSSLVSSASENSSSFAPSQKQPSLSDCDISPIGRPRRSYSIRSRRHRHSDPGLHSLTMRIQFMEDNDILLKHSQSDITTGESESRNDVEITSNTENSLKENIFRDVVERSRSCSRSLSSMSDELEASFQELSLEENSSECDLSPASIPSSSPTFSFSQAQPRSHSPLVDIVSDTSESEISNETMISKSVSQCDKISKNDSTNKTLVNNGQETHQKWCNFQKPEHRCSGNELRSKVAFTAHLSLAPKFQSLQSSPFNSESVIINEPTLRDMTLSEKIPQFDSKQLSSQQRDSSSLHLHHEADESSETTLRQISTSLASPTKPNICECCVRPQQTMSFCEDPLLKSPTKRSSNARVSSTTISPLKIRKMSFDVEEKNISLNHVKRDLMCTDLSVPPQPSVNQLERSPQYFNLDLFPNDQSKDSDASSPTSSNGQNLTFVACRTDCANKDDLRNEKLERIVEMFSPPVPSRLIGRRVGLTKCDIVGELTKQNFLGCLEAIFKYLSDSDLISVTSVSQMWRASIHSDPRSYHRFKRLRHAQRRGKLLLGKENAFGKSKDSSAPLVTAAKGPLAIVQQQAAVSEPSSANSEGMDLLWDDTLRNCPHCSGTALVYPAENRATCKRENCAFVFCTLCFSAFHHPKPCKPLFHSTSRTGLAGTRKSKKNLRRL